MSLRPHTSLIPKRTPYKIILAKGCKYIIYEDFSMEQFQPHPHINLFLFLFFLLGDVDVVLLRDFIGVGSKWYRPQVQLDRVLLVGVQLARGTNELFQLWGLPLNITRCFLDQMPLILILDIHNTMDASFVGAFRGGHRWDDGTRSPPNFCRLTLRLVSQSAIKSMG